MTDASGQLNAECEAGKQLWVTAPSEKLFTSAPASVRETFNSAPVKLKLLGLLGGGVSTGLPAGYLAAEFLESTGTQYIHTGILNTSEIGAQCESTQTQNKYNLNPLGARNMYLGCRLFTPFVYQADVWGVGYNDFLRATHTTEGFVGRKYKASTNFKNNGLAELDGATLLELTDVDFEGTAIISLFGCEVEDGHVSNRFEGRIYNAKLTQGVGLVRDFIPALDKNGIPCMFDKVTKQPFPNNGTGQFIVGMTMEQARKLGKLPNTGGTLTVSLPWEAGVDAKVQDALAKAAENGWTIVEQYREPEPTEENIAVDWLEGTGEQYMKLPLVLTTEDSVRIVQEHFCTAEGQFFEGVNTINYDKCVLRVGQYGSSYYLNRGNGWATGKVPLKQWVFFDCYFYGTRGRLTQRDGTFTEKDWGVSAPCKEYWLWRWKDSTSNKWNGKKKYFKVEVNEAPYCDMVPSIDSNGVPCLFDKVSKTPFYNSGTGSFIAGFETVEAARRLAKLPKVESGELTVSLPAEARDAASMVPTAISIAVSRGWTIIEQYRED